MKTRRRTMQIELREYQKQDFKALETIIRETWHYDDFSTSKTAVKLARVFLSSCLTNYTFSRVAVVDGNVAGIILANNITKHKCPLSNRLLQIKSILSLYSSKEGRNVSKIFAKRQNTTYHNQPNAGDTSGAHGYHTTSSTTYYVTFQVESGDRIEMSVSGSEYGKLTEGDEGKLTFQGTRYLQFNMEN